jgi:antitoxin CcdA
MRINLAHGRWNSAMMSNRPVKKRAVNLFVDVELLDQARHLRINISETLENRLRTIVRGERERRWLEANKPALDAYNLRVSREGLLSDEASAL